MAFVEIIRWILIAIDLQPDFIQTFRRYLSLRNLVNYIPCSIEPNTKTPRILIHPSLIGKYSNSNLVEDEFSDVSDDDWSVSSWDGEVKVNYEGCLSQCSSMTELNSRRNVYFNHRKLYSDSSDEDERHANHSMFRTPDHALNTPPTGSSGFQMDKANKQRRGNDFQDHYNSPFKASHNCLIDKNKTKLEESSRIEIMEAELARLREQIAQMILTQESKSNPPQAPCGSAPGGPPLPPPPPPPPPPVPVMKDWRKDLAAKRNASSKISNNDPRNVEPRRDTEVQQVLSSTPDMSAILKDLGSVKLRSVARSPGGTPLSVKTNSHKSVHDPTTVIALALKRKFRNVREPSLDYDHDKNSSWEEEATTDKENILPPGPHLLRRVNREMLPGNVRHFARD